MIKYSDKFRSLLEENLPTTAEDLEELFRAVMGLTFTVLAMCTKDHARTLIEDINSFLTREVLGENNAQN